MSNGDPKSQGAIGFLTVVEHEQLGLVGGYLVLNPSGRPLEFHCTAPLKPTRAQQILFGPTLESFLYGEQIGQTLVSKCELATWAVCTDVPRALSVREFVPVPVALVVPRDAQTSETTAGADRTSQWRLDTAHELAAHLPRFEVGANRLAVPTGREADGQLIAERLQALPANFDLSEPFSRIREALDEAHKRG